VLGEFGDATDRYATVRSRKNYAATSPITRQSGKRKLVLARYARNNRLADALHQQAFSALRASAGHGPYTTDYTPAVSAIMRRCASSPTA
jgi:hypothetical protein